MNFALQSALSWFQQAENELVAVGRRISDIVQQLGSPLYIYDRSVIRRRFQKLDAALPVELSVHYAVKANPHPDILVEMSKYYRGFDVASAGEFHALLQVGIEADRINFAGPGKTIEELDAVISENIGSISIESEAELEHCIRLCAKRQKKGALLVRVNPAFELSTSGVKMGGGSKAFGIDSERVPAVIERIKSSAHVRFEGIHIFAGSHNLSAEQLAGTFERVLEYAAALRDTEDVEIRRLNMGGGFGVPLYAHEQDLDLETLGESLADLLESFRPRLPGTKYNIELGRFLVAECGVYVSKILYKKESRGQVFLITNGGMHHHLAASGNFGQSLVRRPMPLIIANVMHGPLVKAHVVGPLCTPLDTFGYVELPEAKEGDLVAVLNSGAYGLSASPVNFLSHPLAQEVIV